MSTTAVMDNLERAERGLQAASDAVQAAADRAAAVSEHEAIAQEVAAEMAPTIRSMLLANLKASGLKLDEDQPGRKPRKHFLRDLVANTYVWVSKTGKGGWAIRYGPPSKRPEWQYKAAASLEYGAVRVPKSVRAQYDLSQRKYLGNTNRPILGKRAKQTVKRAALRQQDGYTPRQRAYLEAERVNVVGGRTAAGPNLDLSRGKDTGKSIRMGSGVIVIPPHPFSLLLTPAQGAEVQREFTARYLARVQKSVTGTAA